MVDDGTVGLKHTYIKLTGTDAKKILDWRISRLVRIFGSAARDEKLKDGRKIYSSAAAARK